MLSELLYAAKGHYTKAEIYELKLMQFYICARTLTVWSCNLCPAQLVCRLNVLQDCPIKLSTNPEHLLMAEHVAALNEQNELSRLNR